MNLRFLPLIWVVAALIAIPTWSQTIFPNPRPGAVLWTKTVTNMQSGAALYLTADERPMAMRPCSVSVSFLSESGFTMMIVLENVSATVT